MIEFVPKATANFGSAEAKTIKMTLKADAAYTLPAPVANLVLVPKELTYAGWLAENSLPAGGNDRALAELRPRQSSQSERHSEPVRLPKATTTGDRLTLSFRRKPGISDARYQIEYSTDW